ncbi:hypothetical protein ACFX13_032989 [Malus domestica]
MGMPVGLELDGSLAMGLKRRREVDSTTRTMESVPVKKVCSSPSLEGSEQKWRFTGFYGNLVMVNKHLSWSLLANLGQRSSLPWICIRDFSEILSVEEQLDGNQRWESQMDGFREVIHAC